jgi:hypothetical protein
MSNRRRVVSKKEVISEDKPKDNPQNYSHVKVITRCLNDTDLYKNFKRHSDYMNVLEHVSYNLGIGYITCLRQEFSSCFCIIDWVAIKRNDMIGNPITYDFRQYLQDIIKLESYIFSPTIFRYIYTGLKILKHIQSKNLTNVKVIEIGGGYGGQLYIINILANLFNITITEWTLVDLDVITKHQDKYLRDLNVKNFNTISYNDIRDNRKSIDNYDLLVSSYGLSELNEEIKNLYVELIAKKCDNFYLNWNSKTIHNFFTGEKFVHEIEKPLSGNNNKIVYNN